jgi:hypothetical protein
VVLLFSGDEACRLFGDHALLGFAAASHPNTTIMKIDRRWLKKIIMKIPGFKRSIAKR